MNSRLLLSAATLWFAGIAVATAEEKGSLPLPPAPAFDSTTNDPILLRYKAKSGQIEKIAMDMEMQMKLSILGQQLTMGQNMRIEAKSAVTGVDADGNISMVVKITRLKMKVSGPAEVEFDSDKSNDDPNFKAVMAMIGVGIPCKMSPVGKVLETDLEPLRLAARRANDAAFAKSLEDSTKQMFDGTYVELSEKPVKAGDTYKAGTMLADKTKIHNSYKIRSVAGDKSKALMEPAGTVEMAPGAFPPGINAKISSQQIAGWILFDLNKGYASNQAIRAQIMMDITAMGQSGKAEITTRTTVSSTVE